MRRVLIFASALALLPVAACIDAAASSAPESTGSNRAASSALDPATAADRQMLAYGEANPECRMWTNWQKLCSRTGPGGAVHCNVDPGRRVTPSRPFCARRARVEPRFAPAVAERASAERFCLSHQTIQDPLSPDQERRIRVCTRHDPERPFNGRRAAALMRPGCEGLSDAETGRPVCVRGGDPAQHVPDCGSFAARHRQSNRLLVCGRWSGPTSCHASPVHEWRAPQEEDVTFGAPDPNRGAVHGLFCENL